jgi:DNA-directed RNA polymerase specialized sigma24 family protein
MLAASRPLADAELLRAARRDADAYGGLYGRYRKRIFGYFLRRIGDEYAALELIAQTLSQAWVTRGRFADERDGSAAPWLFGIARNVLRSVRRGELERRMAVKLGVRGRLDLEGGVEPENGGPKAPTNC